jgi:hypothetical protein
MAFATQIVDAAFTHFAAGVLPSRAHLVGEYILGGNEALSVRNRADPARPLSVQGVPTYNPDHCIVRSHASAGFGFETGIRAHAGRTLICVRKNATTSSTVNIVGSNNITYCLRQFGTNNYAGNGEVANNQGATRTRPASASTVYFEAAVHVPSGYGKMVHWNGSAVVETISANLDLTDRATTLETIKIGTTGLTDTLSTNNLAIYFVALYQRPLSLAELTSARAALIAYYASRNVTME